MDRNGLLKGAGDEDGPAVHEVGEVLVGPLVQVGNYPMPFLFRHADDCDPTTRAQHALALGESERNFGGLEQFEGKTHEDRVKRPGWIAEVQPIAAGQLRPVGHSCLLQIFLGMPTHRDGDVDAVDLAGRPHGLGQ
jgi:hypothetical protein